MSNNSHGNSTQVPTPGQNPSPSSSQAVNATLSGPSSSGPVFQPEVSHLVAQLHLFADGAQYDQSLFQLDPQQLALRAIVVSVWVGRRPLV
jgi:hypothetical protein